MNVIFSDYFRYKAKLRGFHLTQLEDIVRYSSERYVDTVTDRLIVIGRHDNDIVMIPYEQHDDTRPCHCACDDPAADYISSQNRKIGGI